MSEALRFDWEWLAYPELPAEEAATFANLAIYLNDQPMTRLYDVQAKTERDRLFAAAYPLALFLAENWWRLRWEPAPATRPANAPPKWRLAHSLAATGAGYVWPSITFHGDGERIFVDYGPHTSASSTVQFVTQGHGALDAEAFEAEVDRFLEGVLARLEACDLPESELKQLWQTVQAERASSEDGELRRLEAMAGFDPDEAPEGLLEQLLQLEQRLGTPAIRELVAASRQKAIAHVAALEEALQERGIPYQIPDTEGIHRGPSAFSQPLSARQLPPWRRAIDTAQMARRTWGLGDGPLDNGMLAAIADMPPESLESGSADTVPYSATRAADDHGGRIVFRTGHRHGRRFALGRLLGDLLYSPREPLTLAAATDARTGRQKFQRAFAQELLCPFAALSEFLDLREGSDDLEDSTAPNEDRIEEAAAHFDVSPVVIEHTLVNNNVYPLGAWVRD